MLRHEIDDLSDVSLDKGIAGRHKRVWLSPHHGCSYSLEIVTRAHRDGNQLQAERRNSNDQLF
jgi:hypothetical protein